MDIELRNIRKKFIGPGDYIDALDNINLSIQSGEFVCLLGPSGCGKTTLLNVVAGLEEPTTGMVYVNGKEVRETGPDRVLMFQDGALFPWLNVLGNVEFGLRMRGVAKAERHKIARHFLRMVNLSEFEQARIHELSGGMRQRVALARALAVNPGVLLMDEPFGALDAISRDRLHGELQHIWATTGKTILFVTHNVREAVVLGDRVLLLSPRPGRIEQEFVVNIPHPRQIESHAVVDIARSILQVMKREPEIAKEHDRFQQKHSVHGHTMPLEEAQTSFPN